MSNNLFYSRNREIRGGFLEAMFEICTKTNKMCGFCGFATFDPKNQEDSKENKMFCGIASSYDTLVSSLPECWLKMTKSQRTTYTKNKRIELQGLQIRGR